MLSGEGNENGEKITAGQLRKKATLHVQHTFFVVLHDYNVKLLETSYLQVYGGNVVRVLIHYLFHCRSFSPLSRYHFSFFPRPYKIFMLFFQQKNVSFFIYLSP